MKKPVEKENAEFMLEQIRPGDKVTIRVYDGMGMNGPEWKEKTGRAVIVSPGYVALNMGGKFGTPGVATAENIVGFCWVDKKVAV